MTTYDADANYMICANPDGIKYIPDDLERLFVATNNQNFIWSPLLSTLKVLNCHSNMIPDDIPYGLMILNNSLSYAEKKKLDMHNKRIRHINRHIHKKLNIPNEDRKQFMIPWAKIMPTKEEWDRIWEKSIQILYEVGGKKYLEMKKEFDSRCAVATASETDFQCVLTQ